MTREPTDWLGTVYKIVGTLEWIDDVCSNLSGLTDGATSIYALEHLLPQNACAIS